jgi:hydroxyacylglutathione hydrolase
MFLRQFLHTDPIGISYLFGCAGKASAAVVDAAGDVELYLREAAELGVKIQYVIDTHVHADHLSAGRSLAAVTGARYLLSSKAAAVFPFTPGHDGDLLPLGNVSVEIWETPGHTPEHISLLVSDRTRTDKPWFILTGHTLMVGDLGRTELATSPAEGARELFKTISRLKTLPDYVEILPGAYAGSVCGRRLSGKPWSTIGFEKQHNQAFGISDEATFMQFMSVEIPVEPPHARQMRASNSGTHLTRTET